MSIAYGCKLCGLLLGVLILFSTALSSAAVEAITQQSSQDHAAYTVQKLHIDIEDSSCIPAFFYTPRQPLTDPSGAVVLFPALGQNALHEGLHNYAHTFATHGLSVLVLSTPGSLITGSEDPKVRQFLLHCNNQQQQQQQHKVSGHMQKPNGLFGSSSISYRRAVLTHLKQLVSDGAIDGSRIAFWGAEWGAAAAAAAAALDSERLEVQTVLLQTPLLGATRVKTWHHLRSQGWQQTAKALSLAAVDWLSGLLGVPDSLRLRGIPLSGLPGSGALLQLQQQELELHGLVAAAGNQSTTQLSLPRSSLLDLLLYPNPIHKLLPQLRIPVAFYAAAADSDTPLQQYIAASKTARFVSFHTTPGSRYSLLAGRAEDGEMLEDVLQDQTMLLIALLGDVDLVPLGTVSKEQQQQQQQQEAVTAEQQQQQELLAAEQQHQQYQQQQQQCDAAEASVTVGSSAYEVISDTVSTAAAAV